MLAGVALRRGASGDSQKTYESYSLSTGLGKMLHTGFEALRELGKYGNTTYFACTLERGTLRRHASSFFMARQAVTGFRITPTLARS